MTITGQHAKRKYHFFLALGVLVADQLSKWLVASNIALHAGFAVLPGLLRITHVENQGAAFGLFAESPSQWRAALLISFSLVALVVVSTLLWKNSHSFTVTGIALALVLGGALGNLIDRLLLGHVVDFLDFYVDGYHWPAFNVADSAIVLGATFLVAQILFPKARVDTSVAGR